jgi:hypothetical protein
VSLVWGGSCALWVSWSFGSRKRPGWGSSGPSSPRGSGLGDLASGLDLALLEADSVTEALVLALGDAVQPDQA